ncbi:MAG: L-alanine-DL-glutamate epimerase related enzymes of enolase superfamily [uncultured archaeon A07HR67]|jgi:L-alanine-DL-glutamate epimerase and related enzymes of enolase superfamily|nr:MAG: L-alanine-DL-glutamate epimerase related enzymes of enolase superfamily [uncultured archaeon A07HR67]
MSTVVDLAVEPLDLPLSEPFEISLGVQHAASNVLVTVETEAGVTGYGEGSPLPPVTGETQEAAVATARAAADIVEGRAVDDYRRIVDDLRHTFPGAASATFAVETAVLDAFCRERELPFSELFGGPPSPVETDLTIPIVSPDTAGERAQAAVDRGYEHLKIKTGTDVAADVERVAAVSTVAPDAPITVDANQGWTPKETARFADRLADRGVRIDLIEQPVPASDLAGLADARRRVDVPVAADEAVFTPQDAVRVVRTDAADVINVKLGKSGPLAAADIAAIARGADLDLMVGCMLESSIGIHASAHVVAGSGAFSYVDLDGNRLLAADVADSDDGAVHEIAGPGHGITPER